MKVKYIVRLALAALSITCEKSQAGAASFVAHEWGTFTSFQGGDGALLDWKPLQSSILPDFVYDWSKPGLGRVSSMNASSNSLGYVNKNIITAKQRMETPVIYFYSEAEQTADLTVKFPEGLITEWFPQASQIGPARLTNGGAGALAFVIGGSATSNSLIHWSNLQLHPAAQTLGSSLNPATSESHYFAARDTDSDYVTVPAFAQQEPRTTATDQVEKFLFYRGAGNFQTPLRVTMESDEAVVLANTGSEPLAHLFILGVKEHSGNYVYVSNLRPGEKRRVPINPQASLLSDEELATQLGGKLATALTQSGLYPKEAKAMVKTWSDSWLQENGWRVLYVLPRAWTDATLPMTLTPEPSELVRVMVGRAEILPPGQEQAMLALVNRAKQGNGAALAQAQVMLQSFGRFAEPVLQRLLAAAKPTQEERVQLMTLNLLPILPYTSEVRARSN